MEPPSIQAQSDEEPVTGGSAAAPRSALDWFCARVPAFDSLRGYSLRSLRLDLFAGLTVAAVAVPQAMAYASIPLGTDGVKYGLYTAIVMTAIGALFDSSRQLINGPTNAICIAMVSAIASFPEAERMQAAIVMAFLVGVLQTCITLFRLGDLTRFISHSVIVGFTLGAAILLALDQLKHLLGLTPMGEPGDHFLLRFYLTMLHGTVNLHALGIGAATIVLVTLLRLLGKQLRVSLPEFLVVAALMAFGVWLFGWDQGAPAAIAVIGDIPRELPSFAAPEFSWPMIRQLVSSSLAIAVLGLLEAVAMAKAIAARTQQKLDINQQCLSEGLANLAGSFFQCIPGSGSLTRSAINVQAGAVSQWSGVVSALGVALTLLIFAPFARYIPRACLAGLLLVSAWRLIDWKQLTYHLRATRYDMQIVLATAFAAFAINIEFCILIGVFLSVVLYVQRAARLQMTELTVTPERVLRERVPTDPECNRILIYNLEGELFFGSAPDLERSFETLERRAVTNLPSPFGRGAGGEGESEEFAPAHPSPPTPLPAGEGRNAGTRVVVLRVKRVRNPDAVCLEQFGRFFERMRERGIRVLLCGVRPDFAQVLCGSGLEAQLGSAHIFREQEAVWSSTLAAVRFAYELLQGDYCAGCPRRGEGQKDVLYYMI